MKNDRFWRKVQVRANHLCWPWAGFKDRDGYGTVCLSGSKMRAHRVAYELHNGPIPAGLHVLHRCDASDCCNPAHLHLGTYADNMRDMARKGRRSTKLTVGDVVAIRRAAPRIRDLAEDYGVTCRQINAIRAGERWSHLQ